MALDKAPYFPIIEGEPLADAYWAEAEDNVRIRVAHWRVKKPKGTVLLFPGRTEYIEKYAVTAGDFAAHGYGVFAIDWRGQGLADRLVAHPMSGFVHDLRDYQKDLRAALRAAKELDLPKPWYLLGHSMGGAIGLRSLMEGLDVQAAAFTGPMWGVGANAAMHVFGTIVSSVARAVGLGAHLIPGARYDTYVLDDPFETNLLTRDADMYARMQKQARAQPALTIGGPSYRWVNEALRECVRMNRHPSPEVPTLTFLGSNERIVRKSSIVSRMARWPNGTLTVVDKGEHEVLMEGTEMREPIIAAMASHFAAHR